MKTIITFKAFKDRKIVYRNIPIKHDFKEIPESEFQGVKLPPISIESQVINYLDEIDKTELMEKYGFDMIIDYYPKRRSKTKEEEIYEFMMYCEPLFKEHPEYKRPFEGIISDHKDFLFGKRKRNDTKLLEIMSIYNMVMKGANGAMDIAVKIFTSPNQKELE